METQKVLTENWLTKEPHKRALNFMLFLGVVLFGGGLSYLAQFAGVESWMSATGEAVFQKHEYWRAWTTLFAHGDHSHLLSNAMLFLPLTYLLTGYFSLWFFPVLALILGGVINLIVLETLPPNVTLLGISGVVYWMGASWLTLYILIERRTSLRKKFAIALFLSLMVFIPETYKPEVSYLSHFVGWVFGILSALGYYLIHRKTFQKAEVFTELPADSEEPILLEEIPPAV